MVQGQGVAYSVGGRGMTYPGIERGGMPRGYEVAGEMHVEVVVRHFV